MGKGAQARGHSLEADIRHGTGPSNAGAQGCYASVYPDWTNGLHRETYAVFAGPAIHYGGKKWWATVTYLPQLLGKPSPGGKPSA